MASRFKFEDEEDEALTERLADSLGLHDEELDDDDDLDEKRGDDGDGDEDADPDAEAGSDASSEDPKGALKAEKAKRMLEGLARRIRSLRERRGMTQDEFASRCGISVSFASLLERGERSPSYETLVTVAEALEVQLFELFKEAATEQSDDPYHARLIDFARKARLSHAQVDRFIAVGNAMFDLQPAASPLPDKRVGPASCVIQGCGRAVLAKGLCTSHYHKARRGRS